MEKREAPVTLDESVEDLVARFPQASGFLLERGVVCIQCGEPAWCSLGALIAEKGLDAPQLLDDLNAFLGARSG
jgi:hypothetical protein